MKDFTSAKEMHPYSNPTRAMYVGAPGKVGSIKLGFEMDDNGKCIMRDHERIAPLIVQRELYCDKTMPEMPVVYILSSGGPNVDGDRYSQEITMREDSLAHITTGAATKIAEMKDNYSALYQKITLEANSYLEYIPEPTIPCKNSRYISHTDIICHESATLFYSEIFSCGRKHYNGGEIFQYDIISVCCNASRNNGKPLFREKFIIAPNNNDMRNIAVMGKFDIFANVIVLTAQHISNRIYTKVSPILDLKNKLAIGITRLPNEAGLLYKVLGQENEQVKKQVRSFCSIVRETVKGKPLMNDFPWR